MKNKTILLPCLLAIGCAGAEFELDETSAAVHGRTRVLSGCYVPLSGHVTASGYSPVDALGQYRIVARRSGWSQLSSRERRTTARWLVVGGAVKGTSDPATGTASHAKSTFDRSGMLFTAGDTFVPSEFGCRLVGEQTLNYVAGVGRLAGLRAGGSMVLQGSINQCPEDPEFGRVDFSTIGGRGELCFDAP